MISRWAYILIGNGSTGKTTFQKEIIRYLCGGDEIQKLQVNKVFPITHLNAPSDFKKLSAMNRSFQEKRGVYESLELFFKNHFSNADICFLSSHLNREEIQGMINELHFRSYNVGAIFLSNVSQVATGEMSVLNWDERFYLMNPEVENWQEQITGIARRFGDMVLLRAIHQ